MHMRRKAFTLIELLVVVAIIVVLIAILLPSLGRAREQSKTVVCQSHFNQLGKSIIMYASSYGDTLPICKSADTSSSQPDKTNWIILIIQELESSNGGTFNTASGKTKIRQMFQCPTAPVISSADGHYSGHPRIFPDVSSTDSATSRKYRPIKYSSLASPSQTSMVFDGRLVITATSANAASVCSDLDNGRLTSDTYLLAPENRPTWASMATSQESVMSFDPPAGDNQDRTVDGWGKWVRFRHRGDTLTNVLMADGHVESFTTGVTKGSNTLKRRYLNISF